ncbi:MAG TPA: hypothetical protein VK726_04375 [Acetobacteraceae bacterium]|jgi:hypothetical protein|nr:hypothetical protein [Acetobacteraceae bacterium]
MAMPPDSDDTDAEREITAQANAMKDQLRKDVASWSKARHDGGPGLPEGPAAPAPKPATAKPVARTARPAPAAAKPPVASGKPFRMSYSGSSTADYIKYMRDRGAK